MKYCLQYSIYYVFKKGEHEQTNIQTNKCLKYLWKDTQEPSNREKRGHKETFSCILSNLLSFLNHWSVSSI